MKRAAILGGAIVMCVIGRVVAQQGEAHPQKSGTESQVKTHDDLQPVALPALPKGMTLEMIVAGDSIYHGKGNCAACHGTEAEGLPAAGDGFTAGLSYAQPNWESVDSLINAGIPDALTRSPIQMPPRGGRSDLTDDEVRRVAAYVWAISTVRGEPWPGGHVSHGSMTPLGIEAVPTSVRTRADSAHPLRRKP
jgi:mono/diheme cytochrome c family protein